MKFAMVKQKYFYLSFLIELYENNKIVQVLTFDYVNNRKYLIVNNFIKNNDD